MARAFSASERVLKFPIHSSQRPRIFAPVARRASNVGMKSTFEVSCSKPWPACSRTDPPHRLISSKGDPKSRSRLTMPRCPPPAAQCRPVAPVPAASRKSAPCSSRKDATSSCPYIHAQRNPACKSRFVVGGSNVPSVWNDVFTISSRPVPAALSKFRLAPLEARNTAAFCRPLARQDMTTPWLLPARFGFSIWAPWSSNNCNNASCTPANSGCTLVAARPSVVRPPP